MENIRQKSELLEEENAGYDCHFHLFNSETSTSEPYLGPLLDMDYISNVNYILVTILIFYGAQFVYSSRDRKRRQELVLKQRDDYYKRLSEESLKMDEERLGEQDELKQKVEHLQRDTNKVRDKLIQLSANNGFDCNLESTNFTDNNNKQEQRLNEELAGLESKNNDLQSIQNKIRKISDKHLDEPHDGSNPVNVLTDRIRQLEAENSKLKSQVETHKCSLPQPPQKRSDVDPELIKFIEDHSDLTIDFLAKAYETILDIKANNPNVDFDDHIRQLKATQANYYAEFTRLEVARKRVENDLKKRKADYKEELTNFNEQRVEHLFKNTGCDSYLKELKEKNKVCQEHVDYLTKQIEVKKKDIAKFEEENRRAEEESNLRYQQWLKTELEIQRMENEKREANWDQERSLYNQSFNMSSASQFSSVLPPPQIDVPPIEEILGSNDKSGLSDIPHSIDMFQYMPPPPIVDMDEIIGPNSSNNHTINQPRHHAI